MTSAVGQVKNVSAPNSMIGRLFHYANCYPDHEAIATPILSVSYAQLANLVEEQAGKFREANIQQDSIVGIKCADDVQHLLLCLAAIYRGATSCTIPSHESSEAQNAIINRCGATHVVDRSMTVSVIRAGGQPESTVVEPPASHANLLLSTSGSTGEPKLVIHRDSDLVAQAHRHISAMNERFACIASLEHNFAKRHRLYCVAEGATNVIVQPDPETLVAQLDSLNVSVLHVSAFQAQELLGAPDIGKLSHICLKLGGSHVAQPLRQQLRDNITSNLQAGYGTTETGAIAFTEPGDLDAGESVGRPLPGIDVRVLSSHGKPVDTGQRGELAIRGEGMFRGYLGAPDLTASRLDKGWFYTGDMGYLDRQGRIHLCGRIDDMFVFNSMNIYPQDIESVIREYPGVVDAAVIPKKSPVHGNIPVALVVFTEHVKHHLSGLNKFVKKKVGIRYPRQYIIVDEIPTNAAGKISRVEAISLQARSDQVRREIVALLDPAVRNRLTSSQLNAFENGEIDITFGELGMDSVARMDFLLTLEIKYNAVISPRELSELRYFGHLASRILTQPLNNDQEKIAVHPNGSDADVVQVGAPPYIVRLFQRIFRYCSTSVQLNKALNTLESRLTPTEVEDLYGWYHSGRLIPAQAAPKFHNALSRWLAEMKGMILKSGKREPELFYSRKIAPGVTQYFGPGKSNDKTLLICFPPIGTRNLMMPNAVLLQHIDSSNFDLLIISGSSVVGRRLVFPTFGKTPVGLVEWLASQGWISEYSGIRTLGFSAGAYPAVIAGCFLKAEVALSISGRLQSRKYFVKNLNRIMSIWRATRIARKTRVLMSYPIDNSRDRKYARIVTRISGANQLVVELTDEKIGHLLLRRLLDRGVLSRYLERTVFADVDDELLAPSGSRTIISFPAFQVRRA